MGLDTAVRLSGNIRRTSCYGGGLRIETLASIVDKLIDTCSNGLGSMTENSLAICSVGISALEHTAEAQLKKDTRPNRSDP